MKLGVCSNFSHRHIGGTEFVLKHISERLVKNYNYEINVYSFSVKSSFCDTGVRYFPCKKGEDFISQINKMDHLFVYSDSFWEWETIVKNIDRIKPDVSIAMVGMYYMTAHSEAYKLFRDNINRYRIITHSTGNDYIKCLSDDLTVNVIPNGVDLAEFKENTINFRKKYDLREKYVIISVSNFFFGKGFEFIPKIYEKLSKKIDDFIILQLSNTVKYPYDKIFFDRVKKQSRGMNIRFLRNLPREDVVSAFKCSDVLLSCSLKEVSPLVILESQAAGLPWVSMNVGDVENRKGGIIINNTNEDDKGYKIVSDKVIEQFVSGIECIISGNSKVTGQSVRKKLIGEGQKDIERLDWKNIVPEYERIFNS